MCNKRLFITTLFIIAQLGNNPNIHQEEKRSYNRILFSNKKKH